MWFGGIKNGGFLWYYIMFYYANVCGRFDIF